MRQFTICILIVLGIFDLPNTYSTGLISTFEKRSDSSANQESVSETANELKEPHLQNFRSGLEFHWKKHGKHKSYVKNLIFTDLFAVHIEKNINLDCVLKKGFVFIKKVFEDEDIYLFRYRSLSKSNTSTKDEVLNIFSNKSEVRWIVQQHVLDRHSRRFLARSNSIQKGARGRSPGKNIAHKLGELKRNHMRFFNTVHFNDPLFEDQWYLLGKTGISDHFHGVNVLPVWKAGITGKGVRISVLDDGVSSKNADITDNYDSTISDDLSEFQLGNQENILENSHGTYCAAIVAGVANNNYCGVGVAYDAKIGGARILNGLITDAQEASGLIHALNYVDIYTASWGPKDDGRQVAGPGYLTRKAFVKGITKGRGGKGSIYVWASGNGGRYFDNCNLDGYASSPFTLTFGALTGKGESTYYTEPCAAVIASTYVGGLHFPPMKKNLASYRKMVKVVVPEGCGKCRENFQGTSAAAPIAAGIIALILQVNPYLTWRDIQHLIVSTARIPSSGEGGWAINGSGKHFHLKIGFGVLDAALLVAMARYWASMPPLKKFTSMPISKKVFLQAMAKTAIIMDVSGNSRINRINSLETVVATVNVVHPRCGNLEIHLVSPSGTVSTLLTSRPLDNVTVDFPMWEFTSLHFWGENPSGLWELRIFDYGNYPISVEYINYFRITFYGTLLDTSPLKKTIPRSAIGEKQLVSILENEQTASQAAVEDLVQLWSENKR